MSWLLAGWISLGFLLLCQATLYQTIQQHHVARPGRTDILTLGTCTSLGSTARREAASSRPDGAKNCNDLSPNSS
ncbi:tafa1 [Pungitius sinensis]